MINKDMVALKMSFFLKVKIFISLGSCQFVEYLFKIKIFTKKGETSVLFIFTKSLPLFEDVKRIYISYSTCNTDIKFIQLVNLVINNSLFYLQVFLESVKED